jgi:hypothetical protein
MCLCNTYLRKNITTVDHRRKGNMSSSYNGTINRFFGESEQIPETWS